MADIQVRNVEQSLWIQLRLKAVERRMSMGALLNEIIREWLEREPDRAFQKWAARQQG